MNKTRQIVLLLMLVPMVFFSWGGALDRPATEQVDAGLKRALLSFTAARALNGAISVVQGTQVDIAPMGVGVTLAPGQILVPLNELIRNFSDLMLAASVAFGVQKFLIAMSSYHVISLLLTIVAVAWAACHLRQHPPPSVLSKLLMVLLMLRFAIPVVVLGSDALSQKFLAADYAVSQQAVDQISGQVLQFESPVTAKAAPAASNLFGRIAAAVPTLADVKANFAALQASVEKSIEHMVKLMVIFLLETLLIPLLLLWGLWSVTRTLFEPRRLFQGASAPLAR